MSKNIAAVVTIVCLGVKAAGKLRSNALALKTIAKNCAVKSAEPTLENSAVKCNPGVPPLVRTW